MKIFKVAEQPYLFDDETMKSLTSKARDAENIINKALSDEDVIVLFHSGTAEQDADIAKYGLIAQFGEWVEECLAGAIDDDELFQKIKEQSEAVFLSRVPNWVIMKASRAANKHSTQMTREDVKRYGQLTICTVYANSSDVYEAHEKDFSYYGNAKSFGGDTLYSEDMPFGVESGDIFAINDLGVDITLTGEDLVIFLERNYPEECTWL